MKKYLIGLIACLFLIILFLFFIIKDDWHKGYPFDSHLINICSGDTTKLNVDSNTVQDGTIKNKPIYLVANRNCNVHQGPGTNCEIIAELRKGVLLLKIGEKDNWYRIRMANQRIGWIKSDLVDKNPTVLTTLERSNIRSGPGMNFSKKFVVNKGIYLVRISEQSCWSEIYLLDGEKGWIKNDLVRDVSTLVFISNTVNIRQGPGTNDEIIAKLEKNTILELIEEKGNWYKVKLRNGKNGWIRKDLVSFSFFPYSGINNYYLYPKEMNNINTDTIALISEGYEGSEAHELIIISSVNLRVSPDMNAEIITVLPPNTRIRKLSVLRDWCEVQTDQGVMGWIFQGAGYTDFLNTNDSINYPTLDHLKNANISFNTPETMKVLDTKTVMLLLSKKESIAELSHAITEQLIEPGKIYGDSVKISTIMEASLTGQGFLINAITPVRQMIVPGFDLNMWKWEVTAKEIGEKKLHLTLNALISDGKDKELHTIKTYERTVMIYVRFGDKILAFLGGNWQFLFGAIVSPGVIYLWKRFISRKQKRVRTRKKNV